MRTTLSIFAVLPFALAIGCSGASTSSDGHGAAALDAPNGGIDPLSREAPAFADDAVTAVPSLDVTGADPSDPTVAAAADPSARSYHVLLVWGHLPAPRDAADGDSDPTPETWNGTLSVDAGAIAVRRTISFDAHDQVAPRTDPKSVSFVSHTMPFIDGMLVRVVVPASGAALLHVKTDALTTDIDLTSLAAKPGGVTPLATNADEGLAYVGYQDEAGCAKGFVHGRWVKDRARFGHLRGVVSAGDGDRLGHVRGLWGHAQKRGADVFFGKYIGVDGTSRGLLGGRYGDGALAGVWGVHDESDLDHGHLEGFYSDGYDRADGRGVWLGRWSEACPR